MRTVVIEGYPAEMIDEVVKQTNSQFNIHLLFGSRGTWTEPGFNFGVQLAVFYNLTPEQAEFIRSKLIEQGVAAEDIRVNEQ